MKLTFLGAAREVTGSRFLLQACGKNIMIDYGMEQGVNLFENAVLPILESEIDYVLLTHAHIDHSGYLPLLYKNGFRGTIHTTETTSDLCRIMMLDSAHIQESDAEWKTRKNERKGLPPMEPVYTQEHALKTHELFRSARYGERFELCPGVMVRMVDVGHLMGSASIELTITEDGEEKIIVFSGDIGNINQPLLRDPQYMQRADFVVMESTYGDRSHGDVQPDYVGSLTRTLQETFDRGGNVIIPSFAVGRTQEMLYFIREIKQKGLVKGHDGFRVYVDSPLGIEATNIFNENTLECADEETAALIRQGVNPISFDGLVIARTADESKLINEDPEPKVIISASGMCDAGRVRHHLKHNLWRPESTVSRASATITPQSATRYEVFVLPCRIASPFVLIKRYIVSVGVALACAENCHTLLFLDSAVVRAVCVGQARPGLDANEGRAARLPDKNVIKVGKIYLYASAVKRIAYGERA